MGIEFHSNKSDLVLHINDQPGEARQRDIETALEEKPGVIRAEVTENLPHRTHVSYDLDETSYLEILEQLCSQSVQR